MADDIDDIYGDLPNFELDRECERLQNELEDLKQKTDDFTSKIDELTKEKEKLVKQKSILLKNISILLKTARQEVQRKDEMILQLRNEIETLKNGKFPRFNPAIKRNNPKNTETPPDKEEASSTKEITTNIIINRNVEDRLGPFKNNEKEVDEPLDKLLRNKKKSAKDRLGQKVGDCSQPNYTDSNSSRNIDKFNRDRLDLEVEHNLKRSNRNVDKTCNETDDRANSTSSKNIERRRDSLEILKLDQDRLRNRCDSKPYIDPSKRSHIRLNENNKTNNRGDSNSCRDKISHDMEYHKGNDRLDLKSSKDAYDGRRERLGPESDNYRKADRFGVRNDLRFHRHADRPCYDNNVRGKRKIYEDDIYDKPYRSSRSPLRHSGSRSPNRKRRRSRSRGTLSGLKEACTTSPPHKFPKVNNPSPPQLEKTDFDNSLNVKVTEQSLDNRKIKNVEIHIGADDPISSSAGHEGALNKSEGKEEGEMSDSDSYKDAEEEHPVEWKPSIKINRQEAPKTIFTLRMEQKIKREDEERKRAMIHAAANDQNHVDTTLFDKPIKINRNENPLSLSKNAKKIFEPNKEVSNIPPIFDSNLGKEIPNVNISEVVTTKMDDKSESNIIKPVENLLKSDKSKLTLNIAPLELVKQSSVETYSPFKENYKLIELSPAVLSKGNSYHKNLGINKNENLTQIEENEKNSEVATDAPCLSITNSNTDQPLENDEILKKESIAEVPELIEPKFDVQKPLKPLLPSDIFGALLKPEPALPKVDLLSPLEENECGPLLNNETKKVVDVCLQNSVTCKNSLQSYRIPKKSSIKKSSDTKDVNVLENKKKESNKPVEASKCVKSDRKKSIVEDSLSTNINSSDHRRKNELSRNQFKKINAQENTSDIVIQRKKDTKVDKKEKITTRDLVDKCNVNSNDPKKMENISKEKIAKVEKAPKSSKTPSREEKDVGKVMVDDLILKNISEKNKSSPISTRRSSKDKRIKKKTEDSVKEAVVPENISKVKSSNDEPDKVFSSKTETGSNDNNYALTPRNISINPTITLDIPNTNIDEPKLSPIIKENENSNKKKEELMSGLDLDATPVNVLESSICEENRIVSPCPITPDIPRELLRPIQSRTNCPSDPDFKNFSEKQAENKSSNDIANFEIFKSVNINNSSSSMDNSHESKTSNRLQNDLCLSETEPDSENSSCEDSDSEASDIMEMFD